MALQIFGGGASAAGLSNTFARKRMALGRGTFVALGDSVTVGDAVPSALNFKDAWPVYAAAISDQRLSLLNLAGVSGETTAQIYSRAAANLALQPSLLITCAGVNDVRATTLAAGTDASCIAAIFSTTNGIPAIAAAAEAAGVVPAFATLPPRGNPGSDLTAGQLTQWRRLVVAVNTKLRKWCADNGYPLIDFYATLVDPTTGSYKAAYAHVSGTDGIHPSPTGHAVMGAAVVSAFSGLLAPASPPLLSDVADTTSLLNTLNPLFTSSAASSTRGNKPNQWADAVAANLNTTFAMAADPDGFGQRFTMTQTAAGGFQGVQVTPTLTAGHTYRFTGKFSTTGGIRIQVGIFRDAANNPKVIDLSPNVAVSGTFDVTFTPTTTGTGQVQLTSFAGVGSVTYWRVNLIDLTAMGI